MQANAQLTAAAVNATSEFRRNAPRVVQANAQLIAPAVDSNC